MRAQGARGHSAERRIMNGINEELCATCETLGLVRRAVIEVLVVGYLTTVPMCKAHYGAYLKVRDEE